MGRKGKQKRTQPAAPSGPPPRPLPPAHPPQKRKGFLLAAVVFFGLWLTALVAMALLR